MNLYAPDPEAPVLLLMLPLTAVSDGDFFFSTRAPPLTFLIVFGAVDAVPELLLEVPGSCFTSGDMGLADWAGLCDGGGVVGAPGEDEDIKSSKDKP